MNRHQQKMKLLNALEDVQPFEDEPPFSKPQDVAHLPYFKDMLDRERWRYEDRMKAINFAILVGELYAQGCCENEFDPEKDNLYPGHLRECAKRAGYGPSGDASHRRVRVMPEWITAVAGLIEHYKELDEIRKKREEISSRYMPTSYDESMSPACP